MATPPAAYAHMTHEREMWQNFGLRLDDLTAEDFFDKIAMLRAEREFERSRGNKA